MDPHNGRRPEEHGAQEHPAGPLPSKAGSPQFVPPDGPARTARLITGDYLLTVNPVDGSEIVPTPPGEEPGTPQKQSAKERTERTRATSAPPVPPGGLAHPVDQLPLLERQEETERLTRLLTRGRSVRLTGPAGAGRTRLLDAVAAACAGLAPDGVVRLSGYRRTATDLMYDLFAAVYRAPAYRPGRPELLTALAGIGAVVVVDDLEFGGEPLEELLAATPECAFLLSATPDVPAPAAASHIEEVFVSGLGRAACQELLERAAGRPLTEEEAAWAGDLWFESEGLPLRFLQAGAVLRQRDRLTAGTPEDAAPDGADGSTEAGSDEVPPLPGIPEAGSFATLIAEGLAPTAQDVLRLAVALGGDLPHPAHLPALFKDPRADAALGELLACGLISPAGTHYRLAATVLDQLTAAGYAEGAAGRAHAAAQHYSWWAGHHSVAPERAAAEADALLAVMARLTASRESGHASAAVLLARTAAPAFAAALQWNAWERGLRYGQEAARIAGEVGEEAYFHHELGVLALCLGNLDKARAELEASIGLRGALADRRGAVAGRRALALVADRTGVPVSAEITAAAAGEEVPLVGTDESASPPGSPTAVTTPVPRVDETAATVVTPAVAAAAPPDRAKKKRPVFTGARRNLVAAGAGALLAAVLGTIVTLGATSGSDTPADKVKSDQSAEESKDGGGLTADEPGHGASSGPGRWHGGTGGRTGVPAAGSTRSGAPATGDASGTPGSTAPGDEPTDGTGKPSTPTDRPTGRPTGKPTTGKPTHKPTSRPTQPTQEPTTPTEEPTTTEPTEKPTTGDSQSPSQTASGPSASSPMSAGPSGTAAQDEPTA
ncbi:AAA family ATPase [Streptomyces sp. Ru73]|uniref:AAA family ATPase n=1 Tax=Streptomyces sp. Ru73 TaxID=2080748 RepID=UPI000CDE36FB|nr:AAA family ATPase [Streptomyces sp. Ru73]POX41221.1 AAA family ATPase [Streptomyces sp. Ru73]